MANAFQQNAFQDGAFQDSTGAQNLIVPLLDGGGALYSPTVVAGAVAIVLPLLDSTSALYAPTVLPSPARVTQVATEVLLTSTDGVARVTQVAVEVLRLTNAQGGSQVIIVG